ncbi:MAG: Mov34/MPN/PAD-1 family protein [Candidatus Riflebacteria bacterium]|nr:Mov34/MPN/PAD-1 family protein [Candidatus Riflebacteria bacterium]
MRESEQKHRVCIGDSAVRVIHAECRKAARARLECGGSMLGYFRDDSDVVTHAIETGPDADQAPTHLRTDSEYQNQRIEAICKAWSGVPLAYVGEWHRHPGTMSNPSQTDLETISRILLDPEYRMPGSFVGIIATGGTPEVELHAFVARPGKGPFDSACFTPVPLEIVEDVNLYPAIASDAPSLAVASVDVGRAIRDLERTLGGPALRTTGLDRGAVMASFGVVDADLPPNATVSVVFPREYPLNAPLVALGDRENPLQVEMVPDRMPWSSLRAVNDWVRQALDTRPRPWLLARLWNRLRPIRWRGAPRPPGHEGDCR